MNLQLWEVIPDYLQRLYRVLVHLPFSHGEDCKHTGLVKHW